MSKTLESVRSKLPSRLYSVLEAEGISELRPSQSKALDAGLLSGESLLVCTPTASGKTLIAELAMVSAVMKGGCKAVYIVPLKALGSEKYKDFKRKYPFLKIGLSIGDLDASDPYLHTYDMIICTSEKLDSLIRHHVPWLRDVAVVVIDEIHLLNDISRGPTLEILITILKQMLKNVQLIALSATIGNEKELAEWLDAKLVHDTWRPVELHKGVCFDGEVEFG